MDLCPIHNARDLPDTNSIERNLRHLETHLENHMEGLGLNVGFNKLSTILSEHPVVKKMTTLGKMSQGQQLVIPDLYDQEKIFQQASNMKKRNILRCDEIVESCNESLKILANIDQEKLNDLDALTEKKINTIADLMDRILTQEDWREVIIFNQVYADL